MAMNIFERYGIKEVANVYFEALDDATDNSGIMKGDIVLYLDTLKVSTVETTAENVSAQGGWGNPKLVTWDYGKDINVTLEDAVISWEEMRILMGAEMFTEKDATHELIIRKNAEHVFKKGATDFSMPAGKGGNNKGENNFPVNAAGFGEEEIRWVDMTNGKRGIAKAADGEEGKLTMTLTLSDGTAYEPFEGEETPALKEATRIRFFWQEKASETAPATELVISPDRYPGTYRVVGDALIRSEKTGNDEAFQFVIGKAKMLSEVTLTMQAEGDPSTFNMTLNVLRDENGNMMSLVKY
jgi:hypothetical protein